MSIFDVGPWANLTSGITAHAISVCSPSDRQQISALAFRLCGFHVAYIANNSSFVSTIPNRSRRLHATWMRHGLAAEEAKGIQIEAAPFVC
jgi:hypothetical protein